ncbi:four helix bundle protein [Patescibacteria group bacterium]|nr:four helix bundle protein [Patescibacteria group bacterium]MBU4367613.1 four helix bundle protein [Patescibacteria group bacterium]MBU4462082.1 four helix bundle protein [Patescibacteria group bacterium]MCG2700468.1 four helix bundle protein [Candidatus Parcubacteria bacterium]
MATYNHLPVYKASYDLLIDIFRAIKDFNREYKYTLGENIKREAMEMITNIYRANSSFSKRPYIEKAREKIETIRMFFRLTRDLGQVGLKRFVDINEKVESVSKQLTAWEKSQK